MSKLSPLGQSMAALFTNEAANKKASQKDKDSGNVQTTAFKIAGANASISGKKTDENLGNPNSPSYEGWNLKKKTEEAKKSEEDAKKNSQIEIPTEHRQKLIRLSLGWEKLLLAQKKICEKAKKLFTDMEAPETYHANKKGKGQLKSIGCIVDLDIESHRQEQEAKLKRDKESA